MERLTVGLNDQKSTRFHWMSKNLIDDPKAFASILICMSIFLAIFIGLQVVATTSGNIIGGSAASVKRGACGMSVTFWGPDWDSKPALSHPSTNGDSRESALKYAESCYFTHSPLS